MTTQDNGITFTGATLTDPLPSGQLIQPTGASLGLRTALGQNLGTLYQTDRTTPYTRGGKRTCSVISATVSWPRSSTSGRAARICP